MNKFIRVTQENNLYVVRVIRSERNQYKYCSSASREIAIRNADKLAWELECSLDVAC